MKTEIKATTELMMNQEISSEPLDSVDRHVPVKARLVAMDAFRGWALSITCIAPSLIPALANTPPSFIRETVTYQLSHRPWDGISLFDVGWPAYLTMSGIALHYSLSRRISRGATKLSLFLGLLYKSILCLPFAFFIEGGFSVPIEKIYLPGVFFVYALTILVAGTAHLLLGFRGVMALVVTIIVGYTVATLWGTQHYLGTFYQAQNANLDLIVQQYLGSHVLMRYLWYFPRILTACLGGLLIATIFQSELTPQARAWWLIGIGVAAINLAWMMDEYIQINKHLWTISFAVCAFGVTCLLLVTFYLIIDVWGCRWFSMPWVVFGMNPLAAALAIEIVPFGIYSQRLVGYAFEPVLGVYNGVLLAVVRVTLCWLCFYVLYRRQIFIRLG